MGVVILGVACQLLVLLVDYSQKNKQTSDHFDTLKDQAKVERLHLVGLQETECNSVKFAT